LRLANLPSSALDRLSRYEASLWRQVGQILFTLDALERRKPLENAFGRPSSRPTGRDVRRANIERSARSGRDLS
jgi:hypothetical protein